MSDTYTLRQAAISPQQLPEHLRGIRENVLNNHIYYRPESDDDSKRFAEIAFLLLAARKDATPAQGKAIDEIADYLKSLHQSYMERCERHHNLIDGIISWAGWAANWTRRLNGNETKAAVEEPAKETKP